MMQKTISAILTAVLATGALAGCGGEGLQSNSDVTTVTVWSHNSHSKKVYEKLINAYNNGEGKEKGIKIEYIVKDGNTLGQTLDLAFQNGTAPDLFSDGGTIENWAAIDDLPGGEEFLEKYKAENKPNETTGKYYRVPAAATVQGLIYNKDMFKAAGIVDENGEAKPPETFDELREVAKKLTNPDKKEYGIILPLKWSIWFDSDILSPLMSSVGHYGYNPVDGTYDYTGLEPIMECFLGIKADNSYFPGAEGIDNDSARAQFATGNIGMKFAYSFDVGVFNDQFVANCDWGVAPYPVIDKNDTYMQRMSFTMTPKINIDSVEKIGGEKLMEVLKFFASDELIKQLYIEGVEMPYNWDIVEGVELTDAKKGWEEFCEMVKISKKVPDPPYCDMSGKRKLSEIFLEDIWTGKTTDLKGVLEEYNKTVTEGTKKFYSEHPEYDPDFYLIPDWDSKRSE